MAADDRCANRSTTLTLQWQLNPCICFVQALLTEDGSRAPQALSALGGATFYLRQVLPVPALQLSN